MAKPLIGILLLLPLSVLAQTQVPNVFEDGTPATAAEVNENFQYVLENASGGCSATQQDNSVLIACADGTSGVIAGAGTVVVLPAAIVGSTPDASSIPTGAFVVVDADETLVGKWVEGNGEFTIELDDYFQMVLANDDDTQQVVVKTGFKTVWYPEVDCQGIKFVREDNFQYLWENPDGGNLLDVGGRYNFNLLIRSYHSYDASLAAWECVNEDVPNSRPINYALEVESLPVEVTQAAYPLRIDQLP